ncbi:MAG TPA: hypothetical protein VKE40_19270 [Gemmataceae bacterium]|nr:hypothetical protein [Gemmataceae bacterium]
MDEVFAGDLPIFEIGNPVYTSVWLWRDDVGAAWSARTGARVPKSIAHPLLP